MVGSENKLVCILDSQGMRVMKKVELESVPAFLNVMGKCAAALACGLGSTKAGRADTFLELLTSG